MYLPNFCSECGTKIVRLHWHPWTSRRFCPTCARRLRKERLKVPLLAGVVLLSVGFAAGHALRPTPPPLIIQRVANSPLEKSQSSGSPGPSGVNPNSPPAVVEEAVYICGARTKKGTPCSRRVHQPARCWQHKGMPAMIAQEKLLIRDSPPQ